MRPGWQIVQTSRADQVDRRSRQNIGVATLSWWLGEEEGYSCSDLLIYVVAEGATNGEK